MSEFKAGDRVRVKTDLGFYGDYDKALGGAHGTVNEVHPVALFDGKDIEAILDRSREGSQSLLFSADELELYLEVKA